MTVWKCKNSQQMKNKNETAPKAGAKVETVKSFQLGFYYKRPFCSSFSRASDVILRLNKIESVHLRLFLREFFTIANILTNIFRTSCQTLCSHRGKKYIYLFKINAIFSF